MSTHAEKEFTPLKPGTVLDERYEIAQFLGKGNFGEVYRAKQLIFGHVFREVALKLFRGGVVTALNAFDKLNDVIIVVGLLEERHTPDIVERLIQVYDMGILSTPALRAFMSMKLIPGNRTLKAEISRFRHTGGMPVSLSLLYLRELLLPLAWMHTLDTPVVHGDLKPANVMMTEDFRLVLVDFGLAAHMPLGAFGGDISYAAPEKLYDLPGGPEADVYSVGILWYELLTGVHPFEGIGIAALGDGDSAEYLKLHQEARRHPIAPLNPNVPANRQTNRIVPASEINRELAEHPQIEMLLNRCLAEDISKRPSNARILLDQIDKYIKSGMLCPSDIAVIGIQNPSSTANSASASGVTANETRSPDMLLTDAEALLTAGKHQDALAIVEKVLANSPKNISGLLLKVKALIRLPGRMNDAKRMLDEALGLAPENPEIYETMADLRMAQGKPQQASEFRKKAMELRQKRPLRWQGRSI